MQILDLPAPHTWNMNYEPQPPHTQRFFIDSTAIVFFIQPSLPLLNQKYFPQPHTAKLTRDNVKWKQSNCILRQR